MFAKTPPFHVGARAASSEVAGSCVINADEVGRAGAITLGPSPVPASERSAKARAVSPGSEKRGYDARRCLERWRRQRGRLAWKRTFFLWQAATRCCGSSESPRIWATGGEHDYDQWSSLDDLARHGRTIACFVEFGCVPRVIQRVANHGLQCSITAFCE